MRFSSEVLPVMSVVTLSLVMFLVEWAPLSLEVEHVEIGILLHKVDYSCLNISHRVSEGAVLSIVAVCQVLRELGAELGLVLLYVIESLHSVMSELTCICLLALVRF